MNGPTTSMKNDSGLTKIITDCINFVQEYAGNTLHGIYGFYAIDQGFMDFWCLMENYIFTPFDMHSIPDERFRRTEEQMSEYILGIQSFQQKIYEYFLKHKKRIPEKIWFGADFKYLTPTIIVEYAMGSNSENFEKDFSTHRAMHSFREQIQQNSWPVSSMIEQKEINPDWVAMHEEFKKARKEEAERKARELAEYRKTHPVKPVNIHSSDISSDSQGKKKAKKRKGSLSF